MFDLKNKLGIKSFSFRHIADNADVAAAVKECEVNTIDLSACHVDYDSPEAQEKVIATYREAGVGISGIGVVGMQRDKKSNRRFFEFARRAGCRVVSCSFPPQGHEEILIGVAALADEFDMVVAIHNHGGSDWLGNSTTLQYVLEKATDRFGVCIDTAWCLQAGEDPLGWLELFGERTYAVHFKDFFFHERGGWKDTIVGKGALRLPEFLSEFGKLKSIESAVVEYEGDHAVAQSRECVRAIRADL